MSSTVLSAVNVIVVKDNQVLLSRRANTGWMDGKLCLPGGHVENNETPPIALVREIQEELGVTIDPKELEFACVVARKVTPVDYVSYEFTLDSGNYEFTNAEPEKCSELVWADINNLPDDVIEDFRVIIEQSIIGGKRYLETGYES